jgi:hypothetical protein
MITGTRALTTGYRMSRTRLGDPVCRITLVGEHTFRRFAQQMFTAQVEFGRMGRQILEAEPGAATPSRRYGLVNGFCKFYIDGTVDQVVVITLVGWHDIHRLAYNMLKWQVEFAAMGRGILKSHRRAIGKAAWRDIWVILHGKAEKPLTFHWGRDV